MVQREALSPSGTAAVSDPKTKTRRRPASPTETERRREWGRRWGRMVKERYTLLLEGME